MTCFYHYFWLEIGNILERIYSYAPPDGLFLVVIGIHATLIGIALPLSIDIVSKHLLPYNDDYISTLFKKEPEYKVLKNSIILIGVVILIIYFEISFFPLNLFLLISYIYIIYMFYKFVNLVYEYTTRTDEIILERILEAIERLIR